ncbi:MAG: hypothetical protein KGK09_07730, partial [Burkholderiales bacterium]|nr:hypothetical protein [Burkholderiales bacterium]
MIVLWLRGAVAGRPGRLLGSVAGMALTVGLLASLGSFIGWSSRTMTHRALANVVVDWQVLVAPGADAAEVLGAVDHAVAPALVRSADYAQVSGLTAQTGGTTQTTGAAVVVGLDADYGSAFPNQLQTALGADAGVRIASQTAANLHVTVGDLVTVQRPGLPPVALRVDGVVNLPNADAMFQAIGVPAGTAPQAPPDNVLILPTPAWHALFDPQAALRPDSVQRQLHVRLHRAGLPPDPQAAYVQALGQARNVEARVAGRAAIANNLAARLDGVRADALYARVLLLFLGAPGAVLAMLLTLGIAGSGGERRRREQALLRLRGASRQRLVRLAVWESLALGAA